MEKRKLKEEIYLYTFPPRGTDKYGFNILTVIDGDKALIIDAAFPEEAKQVRGDLEAAGIKPDTIIISHFHPDHIAGLKLFEDCKIAGSRYYKENLENCKLWEPEYKYIEPKTLIKDGDEISFGNHSLRFISTPGHCKCNITIIIDNDIAFVGDIIMTTNAGKDILPLICEDSSFNEYQRSLERVKALEINTLLPAHGKVFEGRDAIEAVLDDRLYYAKRTLETRGSLNVKDCLKAPVENYECIEWHDFNVMKF